MSFSADLAILLTLLEKIKRIDLINRAIEESLDFAFQNYVIGCFDSNIM